MEPPASQSQLSVSNEQLSQFPSSQSPRLQPIVEQSPQLVSEQALQIGLQQSLQSGLPQQSVQRLNPQQSPRTGQVYVDIAMDPTLNPHGQILTSEQPLIDSDMENSVQTFEANSLAKPNEDNSKGDTSRAKGKGAKTTRKKTAPKAKAPAAAKKKTAAKKTTETKKSSTKAKAVAKKSTSEKSPRKSPNVAKKSTTPDRKGTNRWLRRRSRQESDVVMVSDSPVPPCTRRAVVMVHRLRGRDIEMSQTDYMDTTSEYETEIESEKDKEKRKRNEKQKEKDTVAIDKENEKDTAVIDKGKEKETVAMEKDTKEEKTSVEPAANESPDAEVNKKRETLNTLPHEVHQSKVPEPRTVEPELDDEDDLVEVPEEAPYIEFSATKNHMTDPQLMTLWIDGTPLKVIGKNRLSLSLYQCCRCAFSHISPPELLAHMKQSHTDHVNSDDNDHKTDVLFMKCNHCDFIAYNELSLWYHFSYFHFLYNILPDVDDRAILSVVKEENDDSDPGLSYSCPYVDCKESGDRPGAIVHHLILEHQKQEDDPYIFEGYTLIQEDDRRKQGTVIARQVLVCLYCIQTVVRTGVADMMKHIYWTHSLKKLQYACTQPGCRRQYANPELMEQHYRRKHRKITQTTCLVSVILPTKTEDPQLFFNIMAPQPGRLMNGKTTRRKTVKRESSDKQKSEAKTSTEPSGPCITIDDEEEDGNKFLSEQTEKGSGVVEEPEMQMTEEPQSSQPDSKSENQKAPPQNHKTEHHSTALPVNTSTLPHPTPHTIESSTQNTSALSPEKSPIKWHVSTKPQFDSALNVRSTPPPAQSVKDAEPQSVPSEDTTPSQSPQIMTAPPPDTASSVNTTVSSEDPAPTQEQQSVAQSQPQQSTSVDDMYSGLSDSEDSDVEFVQESSSVLSATVSEKPKPKKVDFSMMTTPYDIDKEMRPEFIAPITLSDSDDDEEAQVLQVDCGTSTVVEVEESPARLSRGQFQGQPRQNAQSFNEKSVGQTPPTHSHQPPSSSQSQLLPPAHQPQHPPCPREPPVRHPPQPPGPPKPQRFPSQPQQYRTIRPRPPEPGQQEPRQQHIVMPRFYQQRRCDLDRPRPPRPRHQAQPQRPLHPSPQPEMSEQVDSDSDVEFLEEESSSDYPFPPQPPSQSVQKSNLPLQSPAPTNMVSSSCSPGAVVIQSPPPPPPPPPSQHAPARQQIPPRQQTPPQQQMPSRPNRPPPPQQFQSQQGVQQQDVPQERPQLRQQQQQNRAPPQQPQYPQHVSDPEQEGAPRPLQKLNIPQTHHGQPPQQLAMQPQQSRQQQPVPNLQQPCQQQRQRTSSSQGQTQQFQQRPDQQRAPQQEQCVPPQQQQQQPMPPPQHQQLGPPPQQSQQHHYQQQGPPRHLQQQHRSLSHPPAGPPPHGVGRGNFLRSPTNIVEADTTSSDVEVIELDDDDDELEEGELASKPQQTQKRKPNSPLRAKILEYLPPKRQRQSSEPSETTSSGSFMNAYQSFQQQVPRPNLDPAPSSSNNTVANTPESSPMLINITPLPTRGKKGWAKAFKNFVEKK